MPHHHHDHHRPPHGPHGPQWIFNAAGDIERGKFYDQVAAIAGELGEIGSVQLGDTQVEVPTDLVGIVRFERTPHGTLALVFRAEWDETHGASPSTSTPIAAVQGVVSAP